MSHDENDVADGFESWCTQGLDKPEGARVMRTG